MKKNIFSTDNGWTGLITRLGIGLVLLPHGAQKTLGLFGGYGFTGTMHFFSGTMHLPWLVGLLVIAIEAAGSLALIAGFASRIVAALVLVLMAGIIVSSHIDNGFFMNWAGTQKGEGYEYHLLMMALAAATISTGSGKYSLDGLLFAGRQ